MFPLPKKGSSLLLCYVTDRRLFAAEPPQAHEILLEKMAAAAEAGVDWIQIREKDLSGKESNTLAREAVELAARCRGAGAPSRLLSQGGAGIGARISLNDRLDVALAADAGGVHLGEHSLPPQEARRLLERLGRRDFLIGVSCHSSQAAKEAERGGADYLFFGPVFSTPSKADYGAPQGLDRLGEVCRAVALPVLAIGGITLGNAGACLSAGASGVAAIRLFQDTLELPALVQALRKLSR